MTFTTPTFLIFLVVVWTLYWSLSRRWQNRLLVVASLVFYGWWDPRFVLLLLFTATVDYWVALGLQSTEQPERRKRLLAASLVSNLGVLGFFKYFNFFASSAERSAEMLGWHLDTFTLSIILPVGISFYTFQALGYTIDVYRGRLPAVRDFVEFLGFITFFPQLVAGPIERATNLLVQFQHERRFDSTAAADGARQMLWGFFKKMVVADSMAPIVVAAFDNPASASGWQLLWATYAFAIQVYCDFSGYADIAIGCARFFDFKLMRNFAYPYFSESIPEFWRRWHISLSTWFRDYIYFPLGGNRVGSARRALNVLIVFGISGLWHGANWTFVAFGVFHACLYLAYVWLWPASQDRTRDLAAEQSILPGPARLLRMALTFQLVCISFVYFRASSLGDAHLILRRIVTDLVSGEFEPPPSGRAVLLAGSMILVEWLARLQPHGLTIGSWPRPLRHAAYYALVAGILLLANFEHIPFIYFQF
jgi:D-alanyl-lipoteichoic acid acyltransferase DltB (MBOAT superfamily)